MRRDLKCRVRLVDTGTSQVHTLSLVVGTFKAPLGDRQGHRAALKSTPDHSMRHSKRLCLPCLMIRPESLPKQSPVSLFFLRIFLAVTHVFPRLSNSKAAQMAWGRGAGVCGCERPPLPPEGPRPCGSRTAVLPSSASGQGRQRAQPRHTPGALPSLPGRCRP